MPTPLTHRPALDLAAFPWAAEPLEEVAAAQPADAAAALGFALSRLAPPREVADTRPLALVTTALWLRERGRPFSHGLAAWGAAAERLIWVRAEREAEALWALEEALKSGAVAGGLATLEAPSLVATRRLDFAARAGGGDRAGAAGGTDRRPQRGAAALADRGTRLGRGRF